MSRRHRLIVRAGWSCMGRGDGGLSDRAQHEDARLERGGQSVSHGDRAQGVLVCQPPGGRPDLHRRGTLVLRGTPQAPAAGRSSAISMATSAAAPGVYASNVFHSSLVVFPVETIRFAAPGGSRHRPGGSCVSFKR